MDQSFVTRIVEAALLASTQPVTLAQLQSLFPDDQPAPADSIEQALQALREGCSDRGVELVELASGFRFQVQADVHPWVARLWTDRKTRYTRATLETLALIAYRQPITRGEIEQVRGVAVSSNIIQSLEEREWIRVVGHRDVPGKPALFGTTKGFLDYFGLKRLDELPPLSELKDIGELEPQLQFDQAPQAGPAPGGAIPTGGLGRGDGSDAEPSADAAGAADAANDPDGRTVDAAVADPADADSGSDHLDADSDADRDSGTDTDSTDTDTDDFDRDDGPSGDAATRTTEHPDTAPEPASRSAEEGNPDAAPGERAADENDREQDNAVETTTVPEFEATSAQDEPEQQK